MVERRSAFEHTDRQIVPIAKSAAGERAVLTLRAANLPLW
jgi:hypothetical protein